MKKITLLFLMFMSAFAFAQFPAPYCGPLTFTNNVEPITLVNFAGINNSTDATVGSANPAHEDFTAIIGNVLAGSTYPITLKGNTDGASYTTKLRVYIDWNQNNDFTDAGESYDIGNITGSTGTDAIQLVGSIIVPTTALAGNTRMRVIKKYNSYATSCQTGSGWGQAEDYTLTVTIPACLGASSGIATVTSSTTADLSWTSGGATDVEVMIQLAGTGTPSAANNTGVNVSGTTYSATSLTPQTAYEFYVRSECVIGTTFSTWSGPFSFNTTQLPGCTTLIDPADGAIDIPVGDTTFTWNTPSTGDPATSYDFYASIALPLTTADLIGNYTTTSALITLSGYNTTFYWTVVPKNVAGEATGCIGSPSSFTTAGPPPPPLNDDCANATAITTLPYSFTQDDAIGATNNAGFITGCPDGMNDGVWYTVVGDGADITITSTPTGSLFDPQIGVYTGSCDAFNCEGTADVGFEGDLETYTISASIIGTTYYINIGNYSGFTDNEEGSFVLDVSSTLASATFNTTKFSISPNPVKDVLNISNSTTISKIQVINLLGQEMIVKSLNENQGQIDMSQLSTGTYLVKLTSDNQVKTIKVIKE
jgi:GEVED domain/Secretion system C-terminal sorting domain